jgi:hypothetical protein
MVVAYSVPLFQWRLLKMDYMLMPIQMVFVNLGDRIDYTFVVTNTGDQTLTNIRRVMKSSYIRWSHTSLSAGSSDSTTFTGTYSITQNDIDAAVVYNSATVPEVTPIGTEISAASTDPTRLYSMSSKSSCSTCSHCPDTNTCYSLSKTASVSG